MTTPTTYATDARRWAAVARRDGRADGAFVYAVTTTGVYCRPSCPSRRPNRANVRFFPAAGPAERAGFRACRRCTPDRTAPPQVPEAVVAACRLIEAADEPPSLAALAGAVGLSPFHFHRLFKRAVGVTPKAYAAARRAGRLRAGLAAGRPVAAAMYAAGFGAGSRGYGETAAALGMTPTEYKAGGAGRVIRYATVGCSLGRLLVAATDRGVCAIEFGDADEALVAGLATRFPQAERVGDDAGFAAWVAQVVAVVEAPGTGLDLPLDIRGTAFQKRVWETIRAIPAGSTATYAEVAGRVGRPGAARAVARACAANPVAVAVPCHRVVPAGGGTGGYRWGPDRKEQLLGREAGAGGGDS